MNEMTTQDTLIGKSIKMGRTGGKQSKSGSINYLSRKQAGWVEGAGHFSETEPHHSFEEGRGWSYVQMYNPSRERLLSLILTGIYESEDEDGSPQREEAAPGLSAKAAVRDRFPAKSKSPEKDYEKADSAGKVRSHLLRNAGNYHEEIPIDPASGGFAIYSSLWDHVERKGDEWVATYYDATIERL